MKSLNFSSPLLTNSMQMNFNWEANCCSGIKKITSILRKPATGLYPETHESNPHPHILFFKIYFNIILPSTPISPAIITTVIIVNHFVDCHNGFRFFQEKMIIHIGLFYLKFLKFRVYRYTI
jgi:hypothetical protein